MQIIRTVIWLTFLRALHCYPNQLKFNILDLDVSTPEEVNSLEREEPLGRSINPENSQNSFEDTVKTVEEIIKSNPALPRLTRGEILDLLENITTTDEQKAELLGKNRNPKAVMVVMPYTPSNDKNMEDLYTKAPVTHIIGAEPFRTKEEVDNDKHSRRRPPVQFNDTDNDLAKKPLPPDEKKKYSASISEKPTKATSSRTQVRRKRPQATTEVPPTTYRPTTYHPTSRRPVRRRTTTTTTTSTTTQHPNHRYTQDFVPGGGIRIIESPKLNPTKPHRNDIISDLELQENIKQEVVMRHDVPVAASLVSSFPNPIRVTTTPQPTTSKPLIEEINFPDSLKTVVKDLNLEGVLSPEAEQLRNKIEEQNRIKHILASIGVLRETTTTTTTTTTSAPNAENIAESLSPEMRDLLMSFGLLPNPNEKPVEGNNDKYFPEKAEVKPESYIGFKPLPDHGPSRDDMDALLASFGLGRSARQEKALKVIDNDKEETYNFDMIPEHLKSVISDLGIEHVKRESKEIRTPTVEKTVEKQHVFSPDTQYATEEELKKLEKLISMVKQLEKMNGTVSEEDLHKIDLEGLKELVASLNGYNETFNLDESDTSPQPTAFDVGTLVTLDQKENFPDPTAFDVGLVKNEVKRQESSTSTTSTPTVTTIVTAVSEAETPSLKDLEESFGGPTETTTEPPLPETTTRRTGFYYLVDWNTFLDIDDTKGKRVNLRFQPTIGDPKRFLSVSVP